MAIRARNDFLAVIDHEMRTPMYSINALSSLLMETELTPEQRVMIETILRSSNILATLINDVLDLSRLEVSSSIKSIACVKKLSLTLAVAPEVPMCVVGDEKRLMQTLLNIVGNAVKFTKVGGVQVIASVTRRKSLRDWWLANIYAASNEGQFYLRVQVKDIGCGINPQELPLVFDKFSQFQSGCRNNAGVGLGLAICKRFVNLMGSHLGGT